MERQDEPRKRRPNRKRAEQTAQTLIAALLLGTTSGCATIDMDRGYASAASARPVTVVLVQRGDTVAGIARRFGLTSQAIIEANALSAPYKLTRGQRLVLPPSAVHVVGAGETLSSIARSYRISRETLAEANNLSNPDVLQPGQTLAVPFVGPRAKTPAPTATVLVQRSELAPPVAVSSTSPSKVDPRLEGGRFYASGPRTKPVLDGQGGPEEFAPPPVDTAAVDPQSAIEPKSTGRFIWPVSGKVISNYGRRNSGVHNDGINIAAEPGSPVKAADAGVVVYGGNELAAYGNLLLIRHESGYVTAYAHNKKLLVKRGEAVAQGQTIALVGSTGDVDRPQLHFEIRKGDRAVDPNRYLGRVTASR